MKRQKPKNDLQAVAGSAGLRDLHAEAFKLLRAIQMLVARKDEVLKRIEALEQQQAPKLVEKPKPEPKEQSA